MTIEPLTARLVLRAVQRGLPVEQTLELIELFLDGDEDVLDMLKEQMRRCLLLGDESPPTLEESLHG